MWFLLLVSILHTLVVARSGKPRELCGRQEQPFVNKVCMKFEYITKVPYSPYILNIKFLNILNFYTSSLEIYDNKPEKYTDNIYLINVFLGFLGGGGRKFQTCVSKDKQTYTVYVCIYKCSHTKRSCFIHDT